MHKSNNIQFRCLLHVDLAVLAVLSYEWIRRNYSDYLTYCHVFSVIPSSISYWKKARKQALWTAINSLRWFQWEDNSDFCLQFKSYAAKHIRINYFDVWSILQEQIIADIRSNHLRPQTLLLKRFLLLLPSLSMHYSYFLHQMQ